MYFPQICPCSSYSETLWFWHSVPKRQGGKKKHHRLHSDALWCVCKLYLHIYRDGLQHKLEFGCKESIFI